MTEQLSNLMDEKITSESLDLVLDAQPNQRLMSKWKGYHLISSLLKGEVKEIDMKFDIADKVLSRLESELDSQKTFKPKVISIHNDNSKRLNKIRWGSWAIAASLVGGIYFFNSAINTTNTDRLAPQIAAQQTPVNTHWQAPIDVEARLNALLVEHSEFTGVADMNGLASYSKFVAYQH